MDKWFENKDKKYKIRHKGPDLNNYKPEIEKKPKDMMGLIWAVIWFSLGVFLLILALKGFEVVFFVFPMPFWFTWTSLKRWLGRG